MVAAEGTWHPVASADGAGTAGDGGGAAGGGRGQNCSNCGAVSIWRGRRSVGSGGAQAFCWRPGTSTGFDRTWGCWRHSSRSSINSSSRSINSSSRSISISSRCRSRSSKPVLQSRWLRQDGTVAALFCYSDMWWGVEASVPPMGCRLPRAGLRV